MSAKLFINTIVSFDRACSKVNFLDFLKKLVDEEHSNARMLLKNHEVIVGD